MAQSVSPTAFNAFVTGYVDFTTRLGESMLLHDPFETAAVQQIRNPVRRFSLLQKIAMLVEASVVAPLVSAFYIRWALPRQLRARGARRVR